MCIYLFLSGYSGVYVCLNILILWDGEKLHFCLPVCHTHTYTHTHREKLMIQLTLTVQ